MRNRDEENAERALEEQTRDCIIAIREAQDRGARLAEADALRKDAERWQHCMAHGFPVRNQTSTTGRSWVAFNVRNGLDFVSYGNTAAEAIDAAMGESHE